MDASVLAATLLTLAGTFGQSCYVPLVPFLVSRSEVGLLLSAQGLASCAALVPAGLAVDHFGSKPVLQKGIWLFLCGFAVTSVSTGFATQLLGRLGTGAASSIVFNAAMSMVMERFQAPLRERHIGTVLGIGTLGSLAGAPFGGYTYELSQQLGLKQPQVLAFLPASLLMIIACVALHFVPHIAPDERKKALMDEVRKSTGFLNNFFGVYTNVGLRSFAIGSVLACVFGASNAFLCAGVVEMKARDMSAMVIGTVAIPAGILQTVMSYWGGKMSDTVVKQVALLIYCPIALGLGLFALFATSFLNPTYIVSPIVVSLGLAAASLGAVDAASISLMATLASRKGRGYGEAVTASEMAVTIGQSVGPAFGVFVAQLADFNTLVLICATMALLVSAGCAACLRHVSDESDGESKNALPC
mmetsp:Transcript_9271/g.23871  ORF Transcript_9271/g.23871 Transcript_9271/m.23871 type:complete len:416 (+) Transcript_9271:36-1283(+)